MPAPRKPRHQTEENLRADTVSKALDELNRKFTAEMGERAPRWTETECQRLYRVIGTIYQRVFPKSHTIFAAYEDLRRSVQVIRTLVDDQDNATLEGYGKELLELMAKQALPLETSLFSPENFAKYYISDGLDPGLSTERQWFIFGADGLYATPFGERKPWGLNRSPNSRELALVALAAGDFPLLEVGSDTPSKVIKKMASIMASERRRVWQKLTDKDLDGPPSSDGNFEGDEEGYEEA